MLTVRGDREEADDCCLLCTQRTSAMWSTLDGGDVLNLARLLVDRSKLEQHVPAAPSRRSPMGSRSRLV